MGMDQVRDCLLTDYVEVSYMTLCTLLSSGLASMSWKMVLKNVYSPTIWETVAQGCKLFILEMDTLIEKSVLY